MAKSVVFGERRYTSGCALTIQGVAALREGVKLRSLVTELHVFPDAETWGSQLHRPLVPLDDHDASLLKRHLTALLEPLDRHLDAYLQIAKRRCRTAPCTPARRPGRSRRSGPVATAPSGLPLPPPVLALVLLGLRRDDRVADQDAVHRRPSRRLPHPAAPPRTRSAGHPRDDREHGW